MHNAIPAVGIEWYCSENHKFRTLFYDDAKLLVPLCSKCNEKGARKRAIKGVLLSEMSGEVETVGPAPSDRDALKAMREKQWQHLSVLADAARPQNVYGRPVGVRCLKCTESNHGFDPECEACAAIAFVRETEELAGLGEKAA